MDFFNISANPMMNDKVLLEDEDTLNDETFGAAEIADWEKEHERLAETDGFVFTEFGDEGGSDDSDELLTPQALFQNQPRLSSPPRLDSRDHFSLLPNVEEALHNLVVEDEEAFQDPAIINITKQPRYTNYHQSLLAMAGPNRLPDSHAASQAARLMDGGIMTASAILEAAGIDLPGHRQSPSAPHQAIWNTPMPNSSYQDQRHSKPERPTHLQHDSTGQPGHVMPNFALTPGRAVGQGPPPGLGSPVGDVPGQKTIWPRTMPLPPGLLYNNGGSPSGHGVRSEGTTSEETGGNSFPMAALLAHLQSTGSPSAPSMPSSQSNMDSNPRMMSPVVRTQEDLERMLLNRLSSPAGHPHLQSPQTSHQSPQTSLHHPMPPHLAQEMPRSPQQQKPPQTPPQHHPQHLLMNPMVQQLYQQQMMIQRDCHEALMKGTNPEMVSTMMMRRQQILANVAAQNRIPWPLPLGMPPNFPGHPSPMMPMPPNPFPTGPQAVNLEHQMRQQLQMQQHLQQQQQRGSQLHQQQQQQRVDQQQYQGFPEWASPESSDGEQEPVEGGWMTDNEKDWVVKVTTRAHQCDNPYVQDYYFTISKLHELLARYQADRRAGNPVGPDPFLSLPAPVSVDQLTALTGIGGPGMLPGGTTLPTDALDPSGGNIPATKPYSTIQFDNCLGKVSLASVYCPRQVIDLKSYRDEMKSSQGGIDNGKASKVTEDAFRQKQKAQLHLLLNIEQLYGRLLQVDEFDVSLKKILIANSPNRTILEQTRTQLMDNLVQSTLNLQPSFSHLFSINKGARFFATLTLHLDEKYLVMCFHKFLKSLPQIIRMTPIVDESISKSMFRLMKERIGTLNQTSLSKLLKTCWHQLTGISSPVVFLSNPLVVSFILQLLESFAGTCQQPDMDKFRKHCSHFVSALSRIPESESSVVFHPVGDFSSLILFLQDNVQPSSATIIQSRFPPLSTHTTASKS